MANIKKLKANGQDIVPITHEQAVLDSNGVTLESKLATINNTLSRLENNSTPSTPSLEGNIKILTFGNYTIKYNETDDTLDFIYNGGTGGGTPEEPTTGEVVPLTWAVGNLSGTDGSEQVQENCLRSGFVAIEDNCHYSFYLDKALGDPRGVRVYFYDTNKTYINRTSGDTLEYTSGSLISIDAPDNAAYMRFKANLDSSTTLSNISTLFTLRKTKTAIVNSYVREGLSMYIDANDVATYGSVRDITENYTVTNNGVSLTSDKKYLNFVSTESDYLGTDFVPNLTKWSAEVYFQYTSMPTASQAIFSWGVASDNNIRLAYSSSTGALTLQSNAGTNYPILSDSNEIVKPHHLIITKDNGNVITYLDGVKSVLVTDAAVQSPHNGTLNIGSRYSPTKYFADMNLRTFRFYDGKVLSDIEALQNYNYEIKNNYVTEGLALYIDAKDAATQGSIRDITGNYTVTNNGVSLTSDKKYLNFVSTESDYLGTDFVPNLSTWSVESYFYFTTTPTSSSSVYSWGTSGNKIRLAYSSTNSTVTLASTAGDPSIGNISEFLSLRHVVITANDTTYTVYIDGIKQYTFTGTGALSSHTGALKIGADIGTFGKYADMNLKTFRFYDGKVLTDEEALQNYNYEINRG